MSRFVTLAGDPIRTNNARLLALQAAIASIHTDLDTMVAFPAGQREPQLALENTIRSKIEKLFQM